MNIYEKLSCTHPNANSDSRGDVWCPDCHRDVMHDGEKYFRALVKVHEQLSKQENKGPTQVARAMMIIEDIIPDLRICERCLERRAVYLLGKGINVCNICYQSPEDIFRDL